LFSPTVLNLLLPSLLPLLTPRLSHSTVRSYLSHAALWGHNLNWRRSSLTSKLHERISSVLNRIGCDESLRALRSEVQGDGRGEEEGVGEEGENAIDWGSLLLSRARYLLENDLAPVSVPDLPPLESSLADDAFDEQNAFGEEEVDQLIADETGGEVVAPFGLTSPTV